MGGCAEKFGVSGSEVDGSGAGFGVVFGVSGLIRCEIDRREVIFGDVGGEHVHRSLEIGIEETVPGVVVFGDVGGGNCGTEDGEVGGRGP